MVVGIANAVSRRELAVVVRGGGEKHWSLSRVVANPGPGPGCAVFAMELSEIVKLREKVKLYDSLPRPLSSPPPSPVRTTSRKTRR